jgi:hypothetical protein
MKITRINQGLALLLVVAFGVLPLSCKKKEAAVQAMPPEEVPKTLTDSFKNAPAPVTAAARPAIQAAQANDPRAVFSLSDLASRPDLSPEQREAVIRSMHAMLEQARKAAAKGDRRSEAVMNAYRASK